MSDLTHFEAAWDEDLDGGVSAPAVVAARPRRRHRTLTVVAVAAVASLFGMTAAWAYTPAFNDNAGTPFEDEINWLGWTGISEGYPDGSFRPTQNISRQGLAAWMQRMFDVRDDKGFASSSSSFSTGSTPFVPVTNAVAYVTVPPGTSAALSATFSAETVCYGAAGFCKARIMVDDLSTAAPAYELTPVDSQFALDSTDGGTESSASWEGHSFQRFDQLVYEGTFKITVEVGVSGGGTTFQLDDWALEAESTLYRTDYVPV